VVLMDLSMPGGGGLEATRRIAALGMAGTRVLVLTVHAESEYLMPVLQAGAAGYVTKHSADRELSGRHPRGRPRRGVPLPQRRADAHAHAA
jgi:DNA-binding NarL/FixJ family response regulator